MSGRAGGGEARALVERFGSPLYVYDVQAVEAAYRGFAGCFSYEPVEFHYAIVTNKNPFLVRRLVALGAGIHANTPGDAFSAMAAGVEPDRILYSGTNLSAADFDFLLDAGIAMNLDSLDQIRDLSSRGRGGAIGLRLLVDDLDRASRIGVSVDELDEARALCRRAGIRLTGLHMYAGTNTLSAGRYIGCFERLVSAAELLPDLDCLNAGGGFGIPYLDGQPPLDLVALGRELSTRMSEVSTGRGRPVRLVIEPGRILVGAAGTLVVTVVSVKERGGRRYVGVDSTVGNVVVPSVYHPHHRIEALSATGPLLDVPTDVCGNTTHSRDFLGRDVRLPDVRPGDLLALRDVGAYGYAMSSHFLNRPRPAEVVLDGDDVHLTTRRETFEDLLATLVERGP
ncbi:MAG: diaminopimelate decarboxylase family protein [Acidimicrobiales bacterium]